MHDPSRVAKTTDLRMLTSAEMADGLDKLGGHLASLDSASPEARLMRSAAVYISGATASIREHMAEIRRLRRFVQYVADHSNDPQVVKEAMAHGAK